jgi:pimeloyl-ACP methyl ester carboxylesterase
MQNLRKYGNAPFNVAVIHGGPGAPGEMAPVAEELSTAYGVLEPLQSANSLDGQVSELEDVLNSNGSLPVTLIGFSWGAMLSFILTAQCPSIVKKLILIGSSVFDGKYAENITNTRLSRLNEEERTQVLSLLATLNDSNIEDKNSQLAQFGQLISKADTYDPLPHNNRLLEYQFQIYKSVWRDAEEMRHSGKLLELGTQIQCPVVAIHGDYDPHPPQGIKDPLSKILKDFRFILLPKCGHRPWTERYAKDKFYEIIKTELE